MARRGKRLFLKYEKPCIIIIGPCYTFNFSITRLRDDSTRRTRMDESRDYSLSILAGNYQS